MNDTLGIYYVLGPKQFIIFSLSYVHIIAPIVCSVTLLILKTPIKGYKKCLGIIMESSVLIVFDLMAYTPANWMVWIYIMDSLVTGGSPDGIQRIIQKLTTRYLLTHEN